MKPHALVMVKMIDNFHLEIHTWIVTAQFPTQRKYITALATGIHVGTIHRCVMIIKTVNLNLINISTSRVGPLLLSCELLCY